MNYIQELQRIIDALKDDKTADPKWRNKMTARLDELQAFVPNLHRDQAPGGLTPKRAGASLDDIPEALREFVDPSKITPQQPTV